MLTLLSLLACGFSASTKVTDRYGDTAALGDGETGGGETGDAVVDTASDSGQPDEPGDGDGDGWLAADGDCDDSDPTTHPDAADGCNGVDNDCDGVVDEDAASGDAYEPNDAAPYDLGSLEDDPARSLVGSFTNDDDVERFRFTIVDDLADFFTVTATVSGLPDGMTASFVIERMRSDGDEPIGEVTSTTGSGTLTLSFSDDVLSEDGGDYEVVLSSLGGADCARTWLVGIAQ